MAESKERVSDDFLYRSVEIRVETLKFYREGFNYYGNLLENEIKLLQEDDFLSQLLDKEELQQIPLARELAQVKHYVQILQKKIDNPDWVLPNESLSADVGFRELTLTHRDIRYIKSVTKLYLQYLKVNRDAFLRSHRVSKTMLQTIDTKIARLSESNQGGVFENAELFPLLVDFTEQSSQQTELSAQPQDNVSQPENSSSLPTPIYGLEILDSELHERCIDLLKQLSDGSNNQRFDTIISEATRILENRIRSLPGIDQNERDPVSAAFGGKNPVIQLSTHTAEREGAYFLFRGIFQFIRNPFHHRIIPIDRERVIQLLGMVDYLLYLIDNAGRTKASS